MTSTPLVVSVPFPGTFITLQTLNPRPRCKTLNFTSLEPGRKGSTGNGLPAGDCGNLHPRIRNAEAERASKRPPSGAGTLPAYSERLASITLTSLDPEDQHGITGEEAWQFETEFSKAGRDYIAFITTGGRPSLISCSFPEKQQLMQENQVAGSHLRTINGYPASRSSISWKL